jgi:hypothetical protein
MADEMDRIEEFEAKETARTIPVGWSLLFWGLIAWGAYYLWAYSPWSTGWSQGAEYAGGVDGASSGANVLATVMFTVIPATAALLVVRSVRRRKARG